MQEHQGQCLCGRVSISAQVSKHSVGACHCGICRKWSGGVFLAVAVDSATITGEEHMTIYPSSDWGERGFCSHCGTNLFFRMKNGGQMILAAGLLEDDPAWTFDHQIFIDRKPAYYEFANPTTNMTGEEVFAKFSS